ncbi:MAG: leucine-rich repeat protein [Bacteroidales bacterium]
MKKTFTFILGFLWAFVLHAQYTLTDDDVVVTDGIITSCSYDFSIKKIIIPETLDGQTVIGIADGPYGTGGIFYKKGITKLQLPATIVSIGDYAFYNNAIDTLEISYSTSLTTIGTYAFGRNSIAEFNFGNLPNLTTIDEYAFYSNEIDTIDLSGCQNLKSIGAYAFHNNYSDTLILNNPSLRTIGAKSFYNNQFKHIDLSNCDSLKEIGSYAFKCYGSTLSSFALPQPGYSGFNYWIDENSNTYAAGDVVSDLSTYYTANITYTLTDDDVEVTDGVITACSYDFFATNITIPETLDGQTVTGIAGSSSSSAGLFADKGIVSLKLPSTIKEIGAYAFYENSIDTLNFANNANLHKIGNYAFAINQLKALSFNNCTALDSIMNGVFYNSRLDTVDFSNCSSLSLIGYQAFYYNYGKVNIDLSSCTALKKIDKQAFAYGYVDTIDISGCSSLTYIGANAFSGNKFSSVVLPKSNTVSGFQYWTDVNNNTYTPGTTLADLTLYYWAYIPYTLTDDDVVVTDGEITSCSYDFATKDIIVPQTLDGQSVTMLGKSVFYNKGLLTIQLPATIETIGNAAIRGNTNLSRVKFDGSSNLTFIDDYAFFQDGIKIFDFDKCPKLATINTKAFYQNSLDTIDLSGCTALRSISSYVFYNNNADTLILNNSALKSIGNRAFYGNSFNQIDLSSCDSLQNIGAYAFYDNKFSAFVLPQSNYLGFKYWYDDQGNTYASGDSTKSTEYSYAAKIIHSLTDDEVVVVNGVINTCTYSFDIKDIAIPNQLDGQYVTGIGDSVFYNKDITSIQLPDSLECIGNYAFYSCAMDTLNFSVCPNLDSIGSYAFQGCNLDSLILDNPKLTYIGVWAFASNNLVHVDFSKCPALKTIDQYAFYSNSNNISVNFSNCSVLSVIGASAFRYNKIPDVDLSPCTSLQQINGYAFSDNVLTQFTLPAVNLTGFICWRDANGISYSPNTSVSSLKISYQAAIPYTLTDEDVNVSNGLIDTCYYDFTYNDIIIPDSLDGQLITGISSSSTYSKGVFYNKKICSVVFPDSLKTIGSYAFYNNLIDTIDLSNLTALTVIDTSSFYNNKSTALKLDNCTSLTNINFYAFISIYAKSIDLRPCTSLNYIGTKAFYSDSVDYFILPENSAADFLYWKDGNSNIYYGNDTATIKNTYYTAVFPYTLTDDDVVVTDGVIVSCSYNFSSTAIIIPDTLDGQAVIGIADGTSSTKGIFYNKKITSVKLPSTLTYIGKYAFSTNKIISIDVSDCANIKEFRDYSFYYNNLDVLNLSYIDSLTTIGTYAFSRNSIDSLILNPSAPLASIGNYAFSSNNIDTVSLNSYTTLNSIGSYAFASNSLTGIELSGCTGLLRIGSNAFANNSVKYYLLPKPAYSDFEYWINNDGTHYAAGDSVLVADFNKSYRAFIPYTLTNDDVVVTDGTITSCSYSFLFTDIIMPQILDGQTVTAIADGSSTTDGVFANKGITSIQLPSSLAKIGNYAFYAAYIDSLDFTNFTTLETIGVQTFYGGYSLDYLNFTNCTALSTIGDKAFCYNSLDTLIFTNCTALTSIGVNAFYVNTLHSLDISGCTALTYIGANAFDYTQLNGLVLPTPNYAAFEYWYDGNKNQFAPGDSITDLKTSYTAYIPYTLTDDDIEVVNGYIISCNYDYHFTNIVIPTYADGQTIIGITDKTAGFGVFANKKITSVKLPSTIEYIGNYAFYNNSSLVKIDFSECTLLTQIATSAFEHNAALTQIDLSNCTSLVKIGVSAFDFNYNVSELKLDGCSKLKSIGRYAFYYNAIDTLNLNGCESLTTIDRGAFYDTGLDTIILNKCSKLAFIDMEAFLDTKLSKLILPATSYTNFAGWVDGNGTKYTDADTITDFTTYYYADVTYTLTDDDVVVTNGIVDTCTYDFSIKKIIMPETLDGQTVKGIASKSEARYGVFSVRNIVSISLPSTLETIGDYAFYYNRLNRLNLSGFNKLTQIGYQAFCSNYIDTLNLTNCSSLESIGNSAFNGNYNKLTNVIFDGCTSLKTIGSNAFYTNKIASVNLNGCTALNTIDVGAFSGNSLTSVVIDNCSQLTFIGKNAFYNNSNLTGVKLPNSGFSNFQNWKDGNGNAYAAGDSIKSYSTCYYAVIPYTLTDDDVVVTNGIIDTCTYDFTLKTIIMPSTLDGQTVTGIADKVSGNGVFQGKNIATMQLPTTMTYIGDYSFRGNSLADININSCNALTKVGIYALEALNIDKVDFRNFNALKTIDFGAFYGAGIDTVLLDNCTSLSSIGKYAFYSNSIDTLSLKNCTALATINDYAFGNNSLDKLDLSDCSALNTIGNNSFYKNSIDSVDVSASSKLTYIGWSAFANNTGINLGTLPVVTNLDGFSGWRDAFGAEYASGASIPTVGVHYYAVVPYTLTDNDVVVNNGVIDSCTYDFTSKTIIIPSTLDGQTVTSIGSLDEYKGAFSNNHICSVELPTTLNSIGEYAFYANSLTSVDIASCKSLTEIDKYAFFANSSYLKSIILPSPDFDGNVLDYWIDDLYNRYNGGDGIASFSIGYKAVLTDKPYTVTFNVLYKNAPVNGAVISVEGKSLTTSSEGIVSVKLINGTYSFTIKTEGYNDVESSFTVDNNDQTVTINIYANGVDERITSKLSIYPNPATTELTIASGSIIESVQLISMTGAVVQSEIVHNTETKLNVQSLPKGIYLVKINTPEGSIVKRICKQ